MQRMMLAVVAGAWILASASLAQDSGTAADPATPPVDAVPVDQSTPRGALKLLMLLLDGGDVAGIRAVLMDESPAEQQYAHAMIEFAAAMSELRRQAEKAYGVEGAKALVGDTAAATALALQQIDLSTEELNDDSATVRSSNPDDRPITLRKVDGKWRVPVAAIVGRASPDRLQESAERIRRQMQVVVSVRDEITAGGHPTPESAAQAMHLRQLRAAMEPPASPTAPASAPATQPRAG